MDDLGSDGGESFIVLCDRGLMDGSAYCRPQDWESMLNEFKTNVQQIRDDRYNAVIHLVTAADGASEFFGGESNEARYESIEEAIEKDKKLRMAYFAHPNWFCIQYQKGYSFD